MTTLSYTTMNNLINCPHTWLCKMMGLKTYSIQAFEDGKLCHRIIQDHVSGVKLNPLLESLPKISQVEDEDLDPKMHFEYKYNDKYMIHGYTDGRNPETGELLEIKTGKKWSAGDFAKLPQWKIYGLALPEYSKIWFVNTPRDPKLWNNQTVRVMNSQISTKNRQEAAAFIDQAIFIIENIKTEIQGVKSQIDTVKKNRYCFYIDCPYCPKGVQNG